MTERAKSKLFTDTVLELGMEFSILGPHCSNYLETIWGHNFAAGHFNTLEPVLSFNSKMSGAPSWVDLVSNAATSIETLFINSAGPQSVGPLSGEQLVNTFVTGTQSNPAITKLSNGNFVIAWTSAGQDGSGEGVFAQRFAANGTPLGTEYRVATTTADDQRTPAIAALSDGGFAITWETRVGGTNGFDVRGQRYDASGTALGGEFQVNQATASFQGSSAVAGFSAGGFVVTWQSFVGASTEIYARRFNTDGTPAGAEFQVNSFTTGEQDQPSVAVLAGGGFIVTWQSENQDGSSRGVYGQLYNASGVPLGTEFRANTTTANVQGLPSVTALEGGGFVIVWGGVAVRGQIYAADGTPVGGEIVIATGFNGVSVTAMAGGGFAVAWDELASPGVGDGAGFAVVARAFNASGQPLGDGPVVINETLAGDQRSGGHGSIGQLADGSLAIVWAGNGTGDTSGVFVRRYDLGGVVSGPGPIVGTAGPDTLTGTIGDDVLRGLGDNDMIDGLGGNDVAEYRGLRSDYRVTVANGVYTIDDQRDASPDGTDTLTNVEQLRFSDGENVAIADAVASTLAPGVTPLTGAVLINTPPETGQIFPMTVALTGGGHAVVWLTDFAISSSELLVGRAFDAAGQPVGEEFTVGAMDFLSEEQIPTLTALAGGGFAVAWMGPSSDLADLFQDLQVQIYDATGNATGARLNMGSTGRFSTPVLVGTPDGGFLLIRDPEDGVDAFSTIGQFFNASGTATGNAFPIAVNVSDNLSAAILTNGDIVIAWNEPPQIGGSRAFARVFSPTGQPRGDSFTVDPGQIGGHSVPSVAALAGGGFVITWFHSNPDADIYARLFDDAGNPVSASLSVNENTAGTQWYGYVEALDDGGFVIGWTGNDGSLDGVFARVFDASGQPRGGEFMINEHVPGIQEGEIRNLAQLTNGDLIFGWTGAGANGSEGVFTRRFALGNDVAPDTSPGTPGNDTRRGTTGDDIFLMQQGGEDTVSGADGNDSFYFGVALSPGDNVNGGAGAGDQLILQGNYAGLALGANSLFNVERLTLLAGNDTQFGDLAASFYSYNLTMADSNVAAGATMTVQASALRVGEALAFNGAAETNGRFVVFGGAGNDTIIGGAGADELDGGGGVNSLAGGAGNDRLILSSGSGSTIDGGADSDTLVINGAVSLANIAGIEVLELISGGALTLTLAQFNSGLASNATLGGVGIVTVNMNVAENFISKFFAIGNGVSLVINGSLGADIFKLGNGSHAINAGQGTDQIKGGSAADIINGGDGADKINGAGGADILTGGTGNDVFKYAKVSDSGLGTAADRITDFVIGSDRLNFVGLDSNSALPGDQAFAFVGTSAFNGGGVGSIRYQDSGAHLLVQVDVDGNGSTDMEIILEGLAGQTLAGGNFNLGSIADGPSKGSDVMPDVMDVLGISKAAATPASITEVAPSAFDTSQSAFFAEASAEIYGLIRYYKENNVMMGPLLII